MVRLTVYFQCALLFTCQALLFGGSAYVQQFIQDSGSSSKEVETRITEPTQEALSSSNGGLQMEAEMATKTLLMEARPEEKMVTAVHSLRNRNHSSGVPSEPSGSSSKVEARIPEPTLTNTTAGLQMDIIMPYYGRSAPLQLFASRLRLAITDYRNNTQVVTSTNQTSTSPGTTISTFRLLITCFSEEEKAQSEQVQGDLAKLSGLSLDNIVPVHSPPSSNFSRALALNLLHDAACHLNNCLVAGIDVDMIVKKEFFQNSVDSVYLQKELDPPPQRTRKHHLNAPWKRSWENLPNNTPIVYFPKVFSGYNPQSIALVEKALGGEPLPEYSEHRGFFRDKGAGMYVLRGPDAVVFKFHTELFEGWGGEDVKFFQRISRFRRITRTNEAGLVHHWHPKICNPTVGDYSACMRVKNRQEGSPLGIELLKRAKKEAKKAAKKLLMEKKS